MKRKSVYLILTLFLFNCISCSDDSVTICGKTEYPDWETSDYVLPYLIGESYLVAQGNCTSPNTQGHWSSHTPNSAWAFAYDFEMPIGSVITAIRSGEVVWFRESSLDTDKGLGQENALIIEHEDQSFAAYSHLTFNGVLVELGEQVIQGDSIGISGNSGLSYIPHLHLQVSPCLEPEKCGSIPFNFKNTRPNPRGLLAGDVYEAIDY